MSDETTAPVVTVPIKSAWASKVNITQAVGVAATALALLTSNKFSVPLDVQAQMVAAIQAVQAVATWIMRTWFTSAITAGSVK
jgi:hypothetical protein